MIARIRAVVDGPPCLASAGVPASGNPAAADVANALPRDLCAVPFDNVSSTASSYLTGKNLSGHCAMRHE